MMTIILLKNLKSKYYQWLTIGTEITPDASHQRGLHGIRRIDLMQF